MISKELLSELLGCRCSKIKPFGTTRIAYTFLDSPNYVDATINIYELAYKCKEWAYGLGVAIDSCHQTAIIHFDRKIEIKGDTEPEAIFKACEWILENKDN